MEDAPVHTKFSGQRLTFQDRSEQTRHRLIEAAIEVFAERGFEATNTRTIVERANTNLVSITYYFGSKKALYHAAADYIGLRFTERFLPAHTQTRAALEVPQLAHEQILDLYVAYITNFSHAIFGSDAPTGWGRFICRESFAPSPFPILQKFFEPVLCLSAEFVSRLTGWSADAPETALQSLTVLSLTKCACVDSATLMKFMNCNKLGEHEIRTIEQILRNTVQALFGYIS